MRRGLRCRFNVIYQKLARRRAAVAVLIRRRTVAGVEGGGRLLSLEGVEAPRSLQVFRGVEDQSLAGVGSDHVAGVQVGRRVALPAAHVIVQVVLLLLLLLLALLHPPGTATARVTPVVLLSLTPVSLSGMHRRLLGAPVAPVALVAVPAVSPALGLGHRVVRLPVVQLPAGAVEHLLLHHHDLVVLHAVAAVALPAVVLPAAPDALQLDLNLVLGVAPITSPTAAPARSLPTCSAPRSVVCLPPAAIPTSLPTICLPGAALPAVRALLRPVSLPTRCESSPRQTVKLVLAWLSAGGAVAPVPSFHVLPVALVAPVRFVPPVPIGLVT